MKTAGQDLLAPGRNHSKGQARVGAEAEVPDLETMSMEDWNRQPIHQTLHSPRTQASDPGLKDVTRN